MSSDETVIKVEKLDKYYQVYERPNDRLKQFIIPRVKRLLGRNAQNYFREFKALNNVSFEIKKGETVGIIGRNGSGKSTLLQIICGTLTPTHGKVETRGRIAALLELGSGFNPEFTGRENVYLNATVLGLSKEEVAERFDKIVEFADIGEFIDQPVKTYSSGMSVRLAFAVIAHVDADILIIDEALAVGDAFFVQKCMRFLRSFMEKGTVLFVSHDSSAITNLCSHAIWLQHGEIRQQGIPKEVAEQYLEAQFEAIQKETEKPVSQADKKVGTQFSTDKSPVAEVEKEDYHDMRRDFINASPLRNDIELFSFNPDAASFGTGQAKIIDIGLKDLQGKSLTWIVGGESVKLSITCFADKPLNSPIVGFYLKDRLGQTLFGDNTYIGTSALNIEKGEKFNAKFEFRMPTLPPGQYSLCAALAEGTQADHVQHHWVHDGLIINSHSSFVVTGLVGIPMRNIELELM
ncbi:MULTISPECIES: ABC transporter ATP-binding protein [Halomonadaceae]|uniref:ABC transporter ATP-binding protein n=1 Tax=Halomonadaceae TaxID=28256 RepID=UPI001598C1BD|nr:MULTISPECIES: ABC transporter ATP-binding protein [Halomonas]QJQ96045.1 ABC transporter ATP-binding protein [Halomonas sp. PA5]